MESRIEGSLFTVFTYLIRFCYYCRASIVLRSGGTKMLPRYLQSHLRETRRMVVLRRLRRGELAGCWLSWTQLIIDFGPRFYSVRRTLSGPRSLQLPQNQEKFLSEKTPLWLRVERFSTRKIVFLQIDDISVCLMEAAQTIINENPLTLGKYSTKYDRHEFRHLQRFISRVLPGETDLRDGTTVVHHLNRNAGDLIRCYTRFGRNTGASVELINKLGFEEKKIDRYCEEYEKQKTDHRSEAKRRREQENFEATASEKLDSVEMAGVHHDHSYGSEVSVAVS